MAQLPFFLYKLRLGALLSFSREIRVKMHIRNWPFAFYEQGLAVQV